MGVAVIALLGGCGGLCYVSFLSWRFKLLRQAIRQGRACGPKWLRELCVTIMGTCAKLIGVKIASEKGEGLKAPSQQYIYVWHPHGFISYCPPFLLTEMAVKGRPHKKEWFGTCIPLLFKIPVLGEIFTVTNARPVDRKTLDSLLSEGASIAVQPGGVKEQAASREDQEQAIFPAKLGFVRMAMKYGTPLMPVYLFGENQLYKRVNGFDWLTELIRKFTGMTLPIVLGKFNIPQAILLPRATDIHVRWGKPVDVGAPEENPSEERVQEVFEKYLAELQRVFDEHAKDCLPPAVAAKGLKVVKLSEQDGAAHRVAGSESSSKVKQR